jgi:hypothetical protein
MHSTHIGANRAQTLTPDFELERTNAHPVTAPRSGGTSWRTFEIGCLLLR